ncbi:hypothetical protein ABZX66_30565 [Micromonospora aurantiaca]|uniref:hypothetical protein n=1 Tax=Micromonospora aurantiaca (nom. illeg.) TaxID=47850 RepID=UPI0033A5C195
MTTSCADAVADYGHYRILARHGLHVAVKRRRSRSDYVRWERARPMELWRMNIVGGIIFADGTEAKVATAWATLPGPRSP